MRVVEWTIGAGTAVVAAYGLYKCCWKKHQPPQGAHGPQGAAAHQQQLQQPPVHQAPGFGAFLQAAPQVAMNIQGFAGAQLVIVANMGAPQQGPAPQQAPPVAPLQQGAGQLQPLQLHGPPQLSAAVQQQVLRHTA
eukprot:TRINITY_DN30899_c0_g1_i2.p2 TRINITY_DN30899_c0_g1~~TRINITY_DN30899_c0_g1_i2.p2  ORF type:complete len:150 (+),score=48.89 TRINITY_DN30899_c0_g1_i2:45-452(+)